MKEWLENKLVHIEAMLSIIHAKDRNVISYYQGQRDIVNELLLFINKN